MDDIMKIVKLFNHAGLLIKGATKTIKNATKEQKDWFLGMLSGKLGASVLANILICIGVKRSNIPDEESWDQCF